VTKGWDHDPPAKQKVAPLGILMVVTGMLALYFASRENSDLWGDGLEHWWRMIAASVPHVRRLVIYLDNGPNNNGTRTQFLKRMVQFADTSGLILRLVYYPPYHSKYNRIERCWGILEQKWGGVLLTTVKVVMEQALRMVWEGKHPRVHWLAGNYPDGVCVPRGAEQRALEARLERSATLPKYDITIRPQSSVRPVR
jgi:Rhodopirellula transposase DDE domain